MNLWLLALNYMGCSLPADEDGDGVPMGTDCNDSNAHILGAVEMADSSNAYAIQNSTDANYYENYQGYVDKDGDSYGSSEQTKWKAFCAGTSGWSINNQDCDDSNRNINPDVPEDYTNYDDNDNPIDDNCDGYANSPPLTTAYTDADGDGFGDLGTAGTYSQEDIDTYGLVTNGDDCDDTHADINPDADEVCDGVDNNCDGVVDEDTATDAPTWYADTDSDNFGDVTTTTISCSAPVGFVADATDCDDALAAAYPGAIEVCDGVDNNCDGVVDEDTATDAPTWYADTDSDSFGDASVTSQACSAPVGYVADATDYDDADSTTYPGATDICDSNDNDRDGTTDEDAAFTTYYEDADGDGFGNSAVAVSTCDGTIPVGYVADATDYDDADSITYPGATDICDGIDNDSDGTTDEDAAFTTYYEDADADTYGNPLSTSVSCTVPSGYVMDATDCHDTDASINPAAFEICDSLDVDENCDSLADDDDPSVTGQTTYYLDGDADGFGEATANFACNVPTDSVSDNTDCNDGDSTIYPGASETCMDAVDSDCGSTDTDASKDEDADGDLCESELTDATASWTGDADTYTGFRLTTVDADSDGNDDLIIAAPWFDALYTNQGAISIVSLPASGDAGLSSSYTNRLRGTGTNAYFGYDVAKLDYNNDGVDDLLVGEPGGNSTGAAYIYEGPLDSVSSTPSVTLLGVDTEDYNGFSVAAGDMNGDGYDDPLIGSVFATRGSDLTGAAYFYSGVTLTSSMDPSSADSILFGEDDIDLAGSVVNYVGDVDGDGLEDACIGAYHNSENGTNAGKVYCYAATDIPLGSSVLGDFGASWLGAASNDNAGWALAGAGDLDGDGYPDVVVGAPYSNETATYAGAVYVLTDPLAGGDLSTVTTIGGENAYDNFGYAFPDKPTDVNGDGIDDLCSSAPSFDADGTGSEDEHGAIFCFLGPLSLPLTAGDEISIIGTRNGAKMGMSLTSGNTNGDSFDDLLFGSPWDTSKTGIIHYWTGGEQ